MMDWLIERYRRWKKHRHEEQILKKCGNVCYCSCGATLNDQECAELKDGIYKYLCRCGIQSTFDFAHYPTPVLVSKYPISEEVANRIRQGRMKR